MKKYALFFLNNESYVAYPNFQRITNEHHQNIKKLTDNITQQHNLKKDRTDGVLPLIS